MNMKEAQWLKKARVYSRKYRLAHGIKPRGPARAKPERKRVRCAVCGSVLTVMNNWNFHKTPLCQSPACKRARKTALQRARRWNGGV